MNLLTVNKEKVCQLKHIEHSEQYFAANDIATGAKKVAVLLTVVGLEAYGLIWDLLTPDEPKDKS